ncbi:MAG: ATP-binding cassette domain-containing protein [Coriobacteriales bacterium]|jgi:ABC-type glutathione transport system ATPase component|nr:ATP-binding cassette domain-containing protein [Coriobacteriales bacterium]
MADVPVRGGNLVIQGLVKTYALPGQLFLADKKQRRVLDGLSLTISEGETYGLVGESGSGKTTTGRIIAGLTHADEGSVLYGGRDLLTLTKRERRVMAADIQYIFQDSLASLEQRMTAGTILDEVLVIRGVGSRKERLSRVLRILDLVGLRQECFFARPHELSGGQRQRLNIARALITEPKVIICDEPVSALDVSVQAQILNLLRDLQGELGLTLLFISHDLRVVRYMADVIGVIYQGRIVEEAPSERLLADPQHSYTKSLLTAIPGI